MITGLTSETARRVMSRWIDPRQSATILGFLLRIPRDTGLIRSSE